MLKLNLILTTQLKNLSGSAKEMMLSNLDITNGITILMISMLTLDTMLLTAKAYLMLLNLYSPMLKIPPMFSHLLDPMLLTKNTLTTYNKLDLTLVPMVSPLTV
jgi:hypothetical protein